MPWNDNANPGPWGSPPPPSGGKGEQEPKGPGGRGPRGPGGSPPDFSDLQRRFNNFMRGAGGPGGFPNRRTLTIGAAVVGALYLVSCFIVVGAKEEAIVTTFGAWTRSYGPGIGFHLPVIEQVKKVDITTLKKTDIGGTTGGGDTLMLTGDENIVDMSFSVTWRVSNPGWYLFNVKDPDDTIMAVAESAMREVVGRSELDPIISRGRFGIQQEVAVLMQRILDSYQAGIVIDGVQIDDANPPKEVVDAFRDVNNASQNAESYANEARGKAAQIVNQARGYRSQVVREASGDAARFNQLYEQYRLAPAVTRDRLYIETMERVLAKSNKVIIDGKGVTAPVVLPPDVFRPRTLPGQTAAPSVRSQGAAQ